MISTVYGGDAKDKSIAVVGTVVIGAAVVIASKVAMTTEEMTKRYICRKASFWPWSK